jgi:phosphatidate cytidylyltransferase
MSDTSSELVPRLVTAVAGIPILLYLIFWAPGWAFFGLTAAAGAIAVWEYCSIVYQDTQPLGRVVASGSAVAVATSLAYAPHLTTEVLMGAIALVAAVFLFTFEDRDESSLRTATSIMAVVYGGMFLGTLAPLHAEPNGSYWIILTLVTVWMCDTGAYFGGRAAGNHPLYESVSPNKTVEGAISGLTGSAVGGLFCNWMFPVLTDWTPLGLGMLAVMVIPGSILAQIGDLSESLVKRAHGADDSGSILYGHGGLLDRIDGLIFAAPWFYVCVVHFL